MLYNPIAGCLGAIAYVAIPVGVIALVECSVDHWAASREAEKKARAAQTENSLPPTYYGN